MALLLSGLLGVFAERVRDAEPVKRPALLGIPAGRGAAAVASVGLLGTSGEAALLHFRGAFHDPFMVLPVDIAPCCGRIACPNCRRRARPRRHPLVDFGSRPRWASPAWGFMPSGSRGTWVAGAIGARTCSTGHRFRRPQALPGSLWPVSPHWRCWKSIAMRDLYPGYDVLAKRHTPSWNEQTRAVIERRLAIDPNAHRFFTQSEWDTLQAICARIIPQETDGSSPSRSRR